MWCRFADYLRTYFSKKSVLNEGLDLFILDIPAPVPTAGTPPERITPFV